MRYSIRAFQPCVYIMASQKNGTIYVGVTSDLVKRVYEHKHHTFVGFTDAYNVENLVYYEGHETMENAIQREKTVKHYVRSWKIALIENENPEGRDLYEEII